MFWKLFRTLHIFLYRVTNGRIGAALRGADVLLLTTTGRKSGKKRTTPLGCFDLKFDGSYAIVASGFGGNRHPFWFLNIQRDPRVDIQVKDKRMRAKAVLVPPEERPGLWAKLIAIAPPYGEYAKNTAREIPLVLLYPEHKARNNA